MQIVTLLQGTPEWHAHRANHRNASDTPAVTGHSPYKSRSQFLKERSTGITPEVDPATQRRFDDGHRYEALARPIAEQIIGESLFPVTGTEGPYSASFDGLTMMEDIAFEHKTLNDAIRACETSDELPIYYREQMEHQLMVSGAGKCLFMATLWDKDDQLLEEKHFWYEPDLELRKQITAAWDQFEIDLANYQPEESKPEVIGQAPETLPALRIEVTGMVTASNLDAFKEWALAVIGAVKTELKTDQDFANAEKSVKWCEEVEERLEGAKQHALSQTESIDVLFKTIDDIKEQARAVRLRLEKLVKAEKENRKAELVKETINALGKHYADLSVRIGMHMPPFHTDFGAVIKGLKTLDSMRDKLSVALANAKVEANAIADRIEANRKTVEDMTLFPDFSAVCTKAPEDFAALLALRVAQRQEAEAKRKAAEAERAAQQQAAQAIEAAKSEPVHAYVPAPAATVEPIAHQVQADGPLMKLGEISQRLGFTVTADFLDALGFKPAKTDKAAKLYTESTFQPICAAIVRHVQAVAAAPVKLAA